VSTRTTQGILPYQQIKQLIATGAIRCAVRFSLRNANAPSARPAPSQNNRRMLMLGLAGILWQWRRAEQVARAEIQARAHAEAVR
jgi:hypothetical protein